MALLDLLRAGLLSGIPVAVVVGLLLMVRYRTNPILKAIRLPFSKRVTLAALQGFAFFAAVIVGVIGAWVHGFASANRGGGPTQHPILGVRLAALLSVLAFLPTDQGKRMQGAIDVAALNSIIGVGFGLLVPHFAADARGRVLSGNSRRCPMHRSGICTVSAGLSS